MSMSRPLRTGTVPMRTIAVTIAMVLGTVLVLMFLYQVRLILTWIIVAAVFAVTLNPVVSWVQHRATGGRRAVATLLVFALALVMVVGVVAAFTIPLAGEARNFAMLASAPQASPRS